MYFEQSDVLLPINPQTKIFCCSVHVARFLRTSIFISEGGMIEYLTSQEDEVF